MREYAEGGAKLIVGEAFGVSREARRVADDYPEVAFLMGDSGKPHGSNYAVFDNWIHEPCYLMGVLAGTLSKTGKIGKIGRASCRERVVSVSVDLGGRRILKNK